MANVALCDESKNNDITLVCSDNKEVKLDVNLAPLLVTIKNMLEDLDDSDENDNDENNTIPLPNISKDAMEKVIEFAAHHKDYILSEDYEEIPIDSEPLEDEWDENFVNNMPTDLILGVLLAANFLDFKHLFDIAGKGVALRIHGKGPDEIRKMFNIENDFHQFDDDEDDESDSDDEKEDVENENTDEDDEDDSDDSDDSDEDDGDEENKNKDSQ